MEEIQKKGYDHIYTILKEYCHEIRKDRSYKRAISFFSDEYKNKNKHVSRINSTEYFCARKTEVNEFHYIYFSKDLYDIQMGSKSDRFKKIRKRVKRS